jgi:hypothetical protein
MMDDISLVSLRAGFSRAALRFSGVVQQTHLVAIR